MRQPLFIFIEYFNNYVLYKQLLPGLRLLSGVQICGHVLAACPLRRIVLLNYNFQLGFRLLHRSLLHRYGVLYRYHLIQYHYPNTHNKYLYRNFLCTILSSKPFKQLNFVFIFNNYLL